MLTVFFGETRECDRAHAITGCSESENTDAVVGGFAQSMQSRLQVGSSFDSYGAAA